MVKCKGHRRLIWKILVLSISFLPLTQSGSYFTIRVHMTKMVCSELKWCCRSSVKVALDHAQFFFQSIYIYSSLGLIRLFLHINRAWVNDVQWLYNLNQVNVKVIANLFIISFRPYIISHLPNFARVQQKCMYVRGSEIELKVYCHVETI